MGLRRLFGMGGDDGEVREPAEIDTQITSFTCLPGGPVTADVVIRAGNRSLTVDHLNVRVLARCHDTDGELEKEGYPIDRLDCSRHRIGLEPGAEERVACKGRLPWETPVTELAGQALGVDVSLTTQFDWESGAPVVDLDFLHVTAPPLYEAVFGAFAEEGYRVDGSHLVRGSIPDTEYHKGLHQVFTLADPTRGADRFADLEVVLHQNAVGAMVYVRRADRSTFRWGGKPRARTFAAAHHEVGHADFAARVRDALRKLALIDD
ncbi:sporulation protein [Streptomyces sp. NPDC058861]|uniref:sporulation protein n=1 Tax=Streptomyces sp. NPDC058861 TaxID=3346653 RepID=UPI0036A7C7B9